MISFSPTLISLFVNQEIDNGGDQSTTFEIFASTISAPNTFSQLNYDGVSTTFSIPNVAGDTITAG